MHLKRVRRCLVVWRHLRVSCSVDALKMHGCKTHFTWKFPLKTRFEWMLRSCLATFYYKALRRSHMAAGACHCSKGQEKALLQGFNNARALWRALDEPRTARVEEIQVMIFDSCDNCRKAMAGPSLQLFRARGYYHKRLSSTAFVTSTFYLSTCERSYPCWPRDMLRLMSDMLRLMSVV